MKSILKLSGNREKVMMMDMILVKKDEDAVVKKKKIRPKQEPVFIS